MRLLTACLAMVCGLAAAGVADAEQPGDPPLETALRVVTNGKPATVIYHANGRYDVTVTGSAGHTQHIRSGLWGTGGKDAAPLFCSRHAVAECRQAVLQKAGPLPWQSRGPGTDVAIKRGGTGHGADTQHRGR